MCSVRPVLLNLIPVPFYSSLFQMKEPPPWLCTYLSLYIRLQCCKLDDVCVVTEVSTLRLVVLKRNRRFSSSTKYKCPLVKIARFANGKSCVTLWSNSLFTPCSHHGLPHINLNDSTAYSCDNKLGWERNV